MSPFQIKDTGPSGNLGIGDIVILGVFVLMMLIMGGFLIAMFFV